jgi:hypothetical protein
MPSNRPWWYCSEVNPGLVVVERASAFGGGLKY